MSKATVTGRFLANAALLQVWLPLVTLALAGSGCTGTGFTGSASLWISPIPTTEAADRLLGVDIAFDDTAAERPSPDRSVALTAGRREHASFVLSIRCPSDQPLQSPDIQASWFAGPGLGISDENIRIYRIRRVELDEWPGWHIRFIPPSRRHQQRMDVLVPFDAPRGGLPRRLEPGETYHFWVDIAVPADTFEGTYNGQIRVHEGETVAGAVAVQLTVPPYELLPRDAIPVLAELDHRSLIMHHVSDRGRPFRPRVDQWSQHAQAAAIDQLFTNTFDLLFDAHVIPILPDLRPLARLDANGRPVVNWAQYDQVIGLIHRSAGDPRRVTIPVPRPAQSKREAVRPTSVDSLSAWADQLYPIYVDHFQKMGWHDRSALLLNASPGYDESSVHRFASTVSRIRRHHKARDEIPIVSSYFPADPAEFGWRAFAFESVPQDVGIWAPDARYFDGTSITIGRQDDVRAWLRPSIPPFSGTTSVYGRPTDTACLGWQALRYQCQRIVLGPVNRWPVPELGVSPQSCIDVDHHTLIYPGTPFGLDSPVPSVRLMQLRRAVEDTQLFRLLAEADRQRLEPMVSRLAGAIGTDTLRSHFQDPFPPSWPSKLRVYSIARDVMREYLAMRIEGRRDQAGRTKILEKRLLEETATVDFLVDGTRLRLLETPEGGRVQLATAASVSNSTDQPVVINLAATPLGPGWETVYTSPLRSVPAGSRTLYNLTTEGPGLSLNEDGLIAQVIASKKDSTVDAASDLDGYAPVACVTAHQVASGPLIDGDLSDWPRAQGQRAGNFRVIARGNPGDDRQPTLGTTVQVARDNAYLYLGFRCEAASVESQRDNRVRYDELVPVAGDAVEILIDPLNTATRSPSDIRHVLLKRSGGYLAEIGIGVEPAIGSRRAWPVDLDYAIVESDGFWSAEVRIPISSVIEGTNVDEDEFVVWGLNFCRFDAVHREYSTWSGATGLSYDPQSFGNGIMGRIRWSNTGME